MADTSSSPKGSTPVSKSLPSTPSAQMGGASSEREETKRRSPMNVSVDGSSKPAGKSQVKESRVVNVEVEVGYLFLSLNVPIAVGQSESRRIG